MDWLIYWPARWILSGLQRLPLRAVAKVGRCFGALAYRVDARHRRVALQNLRAAFGSELSPSELRSLASENFRRIGENFACAVRTAVMSRDELEAVVEVRDAERVLTPGSQGSRADRVVAIGHFGNFELFAGLHRPELGYQFATTYRALPSPALNNLMQSIRVRSGCLFFERRTEALALRSMMAEGGIVLGLLADQHAGRKGVWGPFLGRECSTTPAPAVFALRYQCPLFTAFCYRISPGRYRIEVGEEICTRVEGRPRPVADITADINRAFEAAVRRDPANWFWVHNRWKPRGRTAASSPDGAVPDASATPGAHPA
jgi:lauroyl/myristoyl acyltransferase